MSDTAIDRARALLILRETQPILFSDSMNMCDQLADVLAEMVAEVERLGSIKPAFPARADHSNDCSYQHSALPRFGVRWNGPTEPLAVPMGDGYWTPFHLAHAAVTAAEARLRELASAEPVAWQSDRHWDFVARQRLDQSWHPLIRRPEMPS